MGAITPLGRDAESTWEGLITGRSGVRRIDHLLAGYTHHIPMPVRIGAPMAVDPGTLLGEDEAARFDPVQRAAVVAAREAWADAGAPDVEPTRLAVVVGTAMGGVQTSLGQHDLLREQGAEALLRLGTAMAMPAGPAAAVSIAFGARAGTYAPASACAAGAEAVVTAARLIRSGEADVVIAGGADTPITPVVVASFARIGVLSLRHDDPESASRPFGRERDGFVVGEGAGMLVLERSSTARARRARPLARLAGAAITSDGFHFLKPDPSGAGQQRAMRGALDRAGLQPSDVSYVNCHATATTVGDREEALSVRAVFGEGTTVTAIKGGTGHLIGGAGGLACAVTVMSIARSTVPPTRLSGPADDEVALDVVTGEPRRGALSAVLCNAFGFGGYNASIAFTAC
ncbi:beta-ketoacyl-[acyl-carrier-protein] synthase family protein [Actinoplanes couchii]|uniref:3-oxoacyl-ACP synthase n=1 Tax=Actinoplanes couchii TaxID=403638 RepID=A0ABQ3XST9_9ACTN|nr:3-oxoacyl-ACP synthase [Actinoplanes couchii]